MVSLSNHETARGRGGDRPMIYDEPRFSPGGDRYVLIEFGNEMNLELNFMAQGLASAIEQSRTKGVIETAPCFASMLVHYDADAIGYGDLRKEMTALDAAGQGRHGRGLDRDLSGGDTRRLSDLRPHPGADLGHRASLPAVREQHLPVQAGRPRQVRAGHGARVRGGGGPRQGRHLRLQ